jgi:hypothetical protein
MKNTESLVQRLITVIKMHKKPSSPKSIAVLVKILEAQVLNPGNHSVEKFKKELQAALNSPEKLSEIIKQQHSEEELRSCFTNLLAAL